jgi:hypothetical protein
MRSCSSEKAKGMPLVEVGGEWRTTKRGKGSGVEIGWLTSDRMS